MSMKALRFDVSKFCKDYMEARDAGLTLEEFAQLLGVTLGVVAGRKHRLMKRGIVLPPLKVTRKRAAKPVLRLSGPVVQAPLHFTITVGG